MINRRRFIGATFATLGSSLVSQSAIAQRKPKITGKRLRVGTRKYPTIESVYANADPGMTVEVLPGVYNEPLILIDGVDWVFRDGAILDFDSTESLSTITDIGNNVTCSVTGFGAFKRRVGNSRARGVDISGGSNVSIFCKDIISSSNEAVYIQNGSVNIVGNISADTWMGVRTSTINSGEEVCLNIVGDIRSTVDYGVLSGGGNVTIRGNVSSVGNSAAHCSRGHFELVGSAFSNGLFGFEMSGGTAYLRAFCQSNRDVEYEGDAISKYGGEDLTLNSCTLCCRRENAYSIGSQGIAQTGDIIIVNYLKVNRDLAPTITVVGDHIIHEACIN